MAPVERAPAIPARLTVLEQLRVASPCPARWERMTGDDRMRHCARCDLDVHDLSAMTPGEIERLLRDHDGRRLCGRLHRRADGTILTRDCPVGRAAARRRVARAASRAAAVVLCAAGSLLAGIGLGGARLGGGGSLRDTEPLRTLRRWVGPLPPLPRRQVVVGMLAHRPPGPPPPAVPAPGPPPVPGG